MNLYPNDRTGIFIDGPNLHHAARSIGLQIDFDRLLDEVRSRCRLVGALYFSCTRDGEEGEPLWKFLTRLGHTGWRLMLRPGREHRDSTGSVRVKDSVDVDLAVEMVLQAGRLDHVILFSGDGDYIPAVEAAQRLGARVTVVSTVAGGAGVSPASPALVECADEFVDLRDLAPHIERAPRVAA